MDKDDINNNNINNYKKTSPLAHSQNLKRKNCKEKFKIGFISNTFPEKIFFHNIVI